MKPPPNKRLKLAAVIALREAECCALAGTDCRPTPLRRRVGRPQLKRDPLGGTACHVARALNEPDHWTRSNPILVRYFAGQESLETAATELAQIFKESMRARELGQPPTR